MIDLHSVDDRSSEKKFKDIVFTYVIDIVYIVLYALSHSNFSELVGQMWNFSMKRLHLHTSPVHVFKDIAATTNFEYLFNADWEKDFFEYSVRVK
jgi:hypothetical protein